MIVFFRTFPTSPKLDALLIHVLDVLRGEIGEGIINVFQKLIEVEDVCRIEILHTLGVKVPRLGCADLRMVLLEPEEPVETQDSATEIEHKGVDAIPVKWHQN
jgi:hypothetical protein